MGHVNHLVSWGHWFRSRWRHFAQEAWAQTNQESLQAQPAGDPGTGKAGVFGQGVPRA